MKPKVRDLQPHRALVDDSIAKRIAAGNWEPPPSALPLPDGQDEGIALHGVDDEDDADSHKGDGDELQTLRIAKQSNIPQELARHYLALNRKWAILWKPYSVLEIATGDLFSVKSFQGIEAPRKIADLAPPGKAVKHSPVTPGWQAWRWRREYSALVYEPGSPVEVAVPAKPPAWNLWRGFAVEPKPGDISLWLQLLDHLFPDAAEARSFFERWAASQIQNLGAKHYVSVMLHGTTQGSGKSLTGELIGSLFGDSYRELNNVDWRQSFNGWAKCKRFVLLNEIITNRDSDVDLLKNLVTQSSVRVNQKGIEQYDLRDTISYLLTSNKADALRLDDQDRRFWVWEVSHVINTELGNAIGEWKKTDEGRSALLHHLMHVDLDGFDPHMRAPMTGAKLNMIEAGYSSLDEFVRDEAEAARDGYRAPVVLADQLLARFPDAKKHKDAMHDLGMALGRVPGTARLKQIRVDGKRRRPWALIDADYWTRLPADDIRAALESSPCPADFLTRAEWEIVTTQWSASPSDTALN